MRNRATECEWRHAPEAQGGFGEFWRKLVELSPASGADGWLSLARRSQASGLLVGAEPDGGCRWKSHNRKNVYLSFYVEEPLNPKVIKSFVLELRSRKCFSCFEIPIFYVIYIYIYEHYMSISHIRIRLWYSKSRINLHVPLKIHTQTYIDNRDISTYTLAFTLSYLIWFCISLFIYLFRAIEYVVHCI